MRHVQGARALSGQGLGRRGFLAGGLAACATPALADKAVLVRGLTRPFLADVVMVKDGDSFVARVGAVEVQIRIADIDAPERFQTHSGKARGELVRLIGGRRVQVIPLATDRYERTVARVETGGADVARALVERGAVYVYRPFLRDRSLLPLEAEARQARRGLWALPADQRVPPWERRDARREKRWEKRREPRGDVAPGRARVPELPEQPEM
jgi:endonuclease YncB( thermonuclease family)